MAKKVAFLFGAGAEGDGNYELLTGSDYMVQSIGADKWLKLYGDALKKQFNQKQYFGESFVEGKSPYKYSKVSYDLTEKTAKHIIYHKARKDKKFFEHYFDDLCAILLQRKINSLIREHGIKEKKYQKNTEGKTTSLEVLKRYLSKKIVNKGEIKGILEEILEVDKTEKIRLKQGLEFGNGNLLDAYFHSVNDPVKYGADKFSRIINYYWACYFLILKGILKKLKSVDEGHRLKKDGCVIPIEEIGQYFNGDELNYEMVMRNLPRLTKLLYAIDVSKINENSYYNQIAQRLHEETEIECCGVLTTNYYQFCEIVAGEVAYLNGQLKNFEFPELLEVLDLSQSQSDVEIKMQERVFFPFIFGQSLVKPIVHETQVKEYQKMTDILEEAEILVVLGFGINEDDNHINAYLHKYMEKDGNRLIFVTSKNAEENIHRKLRLENKERIEYCKVEFYKKEFHAKESYNNEKIVKEIFNVINQ